MIRTLSRCLPPLNLGWSWAPYPKPDASAGLATLRRRQALTQPESDDEQVKEPHAKIGELAVANTFFGARAQAFGRDMRRGMIERDRPDLSIC
ncbi:hypothetical protein [Paracoccus jeotgali]|uniref:hypothetical protein n=1 Tax=Paracoccus jeotgali TaxID=2065379 RepID=UPI0028B14848|nr:hypothetical protein [Paracoccus jeotgali]